MCSKKSLLNQVVKKQIKACTDPPVTKSIQYQMPIFDFESGISHLDLTPNYCYQFSPFNWNDARPDGSPTVTKDGASVNASFFGQSSFATHAIANDRNVVKV